MGKSHLVAEKIIRIIIERQIRCKKFIGVKI